MALRSVAICVALLAVAACTYAVLGPASPRDYLHHYEVVEVQHISVSDNAEVEVDHFTRLSAAPSRIRKVPHHVSGATFAVAMFGEKLHLKVEKSAALVADRFVHIAVGEDSESSQVMLADSVEHCHYTGVVEGKPGSSVVMSTCNGIEAQVDVAGTRYFIKPASGQFAREHGLYEETAKYTKHIVYRDQDSMYQPEFNCEHKDLHATSISGASVAKGTLIDGKFVVRDISEVEKLEPKKMEPTSSKHSPKFNALACAANEFESTHQPKSGCTCKATWSYAGKEICNSACSNPDGDSGGPWCFTEGSCNGATWTYCEEKPAAACTASDSQYAAFKPKGIECECRDSWSYRDKNYCNGGCNNPSPESDSTPWCYTKGNCEGQSWAYCEQTVTDTCATVPTNLAAMKPPSGCACKDTWTYKGDKICDGKCADPGGSENGKAWCYTDGECNGKGWTYCEAPPVNTCINDQQFKDHAPTEGCACKDTWEYNNKKYCDGKCHNPDGDVNGAWCFTSATCAGKTWSYCKAPEAEPECDAIDSDYEPPSGCTCKSDWSYNGKRYCESGCANPDNDSNGKWCYTSATCNGKGWAYCSKKVSDQPPPTSSGNGNSGGTTVGEVGAGRNVELLLVLDSKVFQAVGSDAKAAQDFAVAMTNSVKARYDRLSLGIKVILVGLITFQSSSTESQHVSGSGMESLLNSFTTFAASKQGYFNDVLSSCSSGSTGCFNLAHDNAQFVSAVNRDGSTTGLAWVGTMCGSSSAGVNELDATLYASDATKAAFFTADTMAHEMGHNFKSNHDGSGNNCDNKRFIMAAIATGEVLEREWSSCSKSQVSAMLQSLESGQSCLKNAPRIRDWTEPNCGDGIKTSDEECDLGSANGKGGSLCTAECKVASTAQCASGECCNSATGKFKAQGTLCRSAAHECDVADYCSGSSASCSSNRFKPDGTSCSSAGPNSKCHQGECVGYDAQCRSTWSSYSGTWVHGGRTNGLSGECTSHANGNDGSNYLGCGELLCTNTEWDKYCFEYECKAGYKCTVGSEVFNGPTTRHFCNCIKAESSTAVYVRDGTPCRTDADWICLNRKCQARPTTDAQLLQCTREETCNGAGECAVDDSGNSVCACDPGFYGDNCEVEYKCDLDCAALHRENCVGDDTCGPCKPRFDVLLQDGANSTACELYSPTPKFSSASMSVSDSSVEAALDHDSSTSWVSEFVNEEGTEKEDQLVPAIIIKYKRPFLLAHYKVVSATDRPSMDPRSWYLDGSTDGQRWERLDDRTDQFFNARGQSLAYSLKPSDRFSMFRITFTAVADQYHQGAVTIDISLNTVEDDSTSTTTTDVTESSAYTPRIQVGDVLLFGYESEVGESSKTDAGAVVGITFAVAIGMGAILILVMAVLAIQRRKKTDEKWTTERHNSVQSGDKIELPVVPTRFSQSYNPANASDPYHPSSSTADIRGEGSN